MLALQKHIRDGIPDRRASSSFNSNKMKSTEKIKRVLSKNVQYYLRDCGMTIQELQEKSGLGIGTIDSVIAANTVRGITITTLQVLADALNVSPGDLVDD